jgi:hypothetical protein
MAYNSNSLFSLNHSDVFWQVAFGAGRRFDLFGLRNTYNDILRQGVASEEICLVGCQRIFNGCFLYNLDGFSA